MRFTFFLLLATVILVNVLTGCQDKSASVFGKWNAHWETSTDNYPGIIGMTFTMEGLFDFSEDSVTVTANGFQGCIFNADTLVHAQLWKISGDTLMLMNKKDELGVTYQIKYRSADKIKLQLMDDILVTLSR